MRQSLVASAASQSQSHFSMSELSHSLNTPRYMSGRERLDFYEAGCDWEQCLENPTGYRPGGYHPVHIGDKLDSDRYRVIHKLSHGDYGTVWLCIDHNAPGSGSSSSSSSSSDSNPLSTTLAYVAVKILQAQELEHDGDSFIKGAIENYRQRTNRPDNILFVTKRWAWQATRHFTSESRNGTHECLVYPVLGPSVRAAIEVFGSGNVKALRRIARETTWALHTVHRLGICHGDFRPSNICLRFKVDLLEMPADALLKLLHEPKREPLWVRGHKEMTPEPEYLVYPIEYTEDHASMLLKQAVIIDFSQSYHEPDSDSDTDSDLDSGLGSGPGTAMSIASESGSDSDSGSSSDSGLVSSSSSSRHGLQIPASYASPEAARATIYLGDAVDRASDCWSLGCVIYEIRLGTPLFEELQLIDNAPSSPRSYLVQICDVLGELPQDLAAEHDIRFERRWTTSTGDRAVVKGSERGIWPPQVWENIVWHETELERIKALGGQKCPPETRVSTIQRHIQKTARETEKPMSEAEAADLADLLEKLLKYDPEERISTIEAVRHRWFHRKYGTGEADADIPEGGSLQEESDSSDVDF